MNLPLRLVSTLFIVFLSNFVSAQDQRGYHLFNPAPRDNMRPFSIDRPDVTESPISVDAGHFQFEGDVIKWTKDRRGESNRTLSIFNGLYKLGITHSWDLHVGVELYNIYQDPDGKEYDNGYGTTTIRVKHNFWGNNGDTRTAFGMIPYVTFLSGDPTDSDVVYGIGLPFSYGLNDNFDLGAQPQFDFVLNEEGDYELSYFQTVVLGGALVGNLDFYVEGLAIFAPDRNHFLANGGLIYNVSPNVKIDVATNVGVTKETPTRVYLGLSFRI